MMNMNKLNSLPEILLLIPVLFYWYSTAYLLNPVAIILTAILIYQIIYRNAVIGIIIPGLIIAACLFMILALMSELSEFPNFNADAKQMLTVGLTLFLSTIGICVWMLFKYVRIHQQAQNGYSI